MVRGLLGLFHEKLYPWVAPLWQVQSLCSPYWIVNFCLLTAGSELWGVSAPSHCKHLISWAGSLWVSMAGVSVQRPGGGSILKLAANLGWIISVLHLCLWTLTSRQLYHSIKSGVFWTPLIYNLISCHWSRNFVGAQPSYSGLLQAGNVDFQDYQACKLVKGEVS